MRLFIATAFPDAIIRDVSDRVARVKTRLPPASWVRAESQHLTFAFLGEQDPKLVTPLCDAVEERLAPLEPFEARVRGCGFFPNSRNARVAWLGVTPEQRFEQIAEAVREAVRSAGVTLDGADFKAHLTLCRIRDHWPPACHDIYQSAFGHYESAPFHVDSVTLFSSDLKPTGAVHTALCRLKLARPAPTRMS